MSRNAERCALRSSTPPTWKRRRSKGVALKLHKAQVAAWLADKMTSQWTAERIYDELQARGYTGGRTVIKEYVREHWPWPQKSAEARFFVKLGQQMQVDWVEMGSLSVAGVKRKLYAFVAYGVVTSALRLLHHRHEALDVA